MTKAEEMFENKQASKLLEFMFAKTYARHALLSEEEFLKAIGFDGTGKTEEEAIRISKINLMVDITKKIFSLKESMKFLEAIFKSKVITEEEKKDGSRD